MAMNFADELNRKASDIERPPLIPPGTYRAIVTKIPSIETISEGKWDVCDFSMRLVEAQDDVDQDELKAFGGLTASTYARRRFMFNKEDEAAFKRSLFDLKRFLLDHLQVSGDDDTSLKELLNQSINMQCLVFMGWRVDKRDGETQYSEITRTTPVM
jgi:hypothetical protein